MDGHKTVEDFRSDACISQAGLGQQEPAGIRRNGLQGEKEDGPDNHNPCWEAVSRNLRGTSGASVLDLREAGNQEDTFLLACGHIDRKSQGEAAEVEVRYIHGNWDQEAVDNGL